MNFRFEEVVANTAHSDEPVVELIESPSKHATQESIETISSLQTEVNMPNLSSTETTPDAKRSITSIETKSTELSIIEQHRLQQVASTGQLKPRQPRSTEEPFDSRLIHSPIHPPEIRVEAVPDDFEEQDLGLRRVGSDSFSFVHGEEDTIDTRDFARDDVETQASRKARRTSWLVRPPFNRAKTEESPSPPRLHGLFRTATEHPLPSPSPMADRHPLRRVKKGLLERGEPGRTGSGHEAAETARQGGLADQPRTAKKLQKKQRDAGSRSSLRSVFYSAVGHGDQATE